MHANRLFASLRRRHHSARLDKIARIQQFQLLHAQYAAASIQFRHIIALDVLKAVPELADMAVVRKGSRLSVMPVSPAHWQVVLALADAEEDSA